MKERKKLLLLVCFIVILSGAITLTNLKNTPDNSLIDKNLIAEFNAELNELQVSQHEQSLSLEESRSRMKKIQEEIERKFAELESHISPWGREFLFNGHYYHFHPLKAG